MEFESPAIVAVLLAAAGFTGWYVGRRAQRAARRQARRRLPADYFAGLNFLINEQPDRAVEVFTRMVDVDKETVEIHFALGSLFRRRGEVDRAIRVHQNILDRPKLDPEQRELALLELAVDYLRAGLLDHSERLFQSLIESETYRVTALRSLTRIYEQERDWEQAIGTHRQLAANGGPAQASAIAHYYCELSEAARAQGELDEARQHLRAARREQRRFPRAAMVRAELAQADGDFVLATRLLRIALKRSPVLLFEVLPRLQANCQRLGNDAALDAVIEAWRHDRRRQAELAQALILTDVLHTPIAVAAVRDYVLGDNVLRGLLQPVLAGSGTEPGPDTWRQMARLLARVLGRGSRYQCGECGFGSQTWFWQCPGCKSWDSMRPHVSVAEAAPATGM
jgi:lipopolysaccharide biosynthesis regulator YciM